MSRTALIRERLQQHILPLLAVLIALGGIAFFYFFPANTAGRQLLQPDGLMASGTARDRVVYKEETGKSALWTRSLFSGMPTYQIAPAYPSAQGLRWAQDLYRLKAPLPLMQGESYLLFAMLLGFYIFLRAWGMGRLLSVAGSVFWCFSSYFLILIDAGHIWKLNALSYIPPTIAGLVLLFKRQKYLLGTAVLSFFGALQLYANHVQMSYYFGFVMLAMLIAWAVHAHRSRTWGAYLKALALSLCAALLAIGANATSLYHTYSYSKASMRGGAELKAETWQQLGIKENISQPQAKGLSKAYITQWSYGIDEMLSFLIPNAKGGYSSTLEQAGVAYPEGLNPELRRYLAGQNQYWGEQPFTAGPVYVGAFVLFLFFLGLMIVKGPMKWALASVTLLTVMLSWGHNLMWLSEWFIDYFPLYNKFRTVSSFLVVAEFCIPLLAIMALAKFVQTPKPLRRYKRETILALCLTAGVALLLYLFPSLYGNYLSKAEAEFLRTNGGQSPLIPQLFAALATVRENMLQADALRAALIIAVGMAVLLSLHYRKLSPPIAVTSLLLLCLLDLWTVDKRYLNDGKFKDIAPIRARLFAETAADKTILKDSAVFRVLDISENSFSSAICSYHHEAIGGYHAAKLQRYQDLIDGYLSQQNINVLRALNTKYYIYPDSLGGKQAVMDSLAYGNAWFVETVLKKASTDEVFLALGQTPLDRVAVVEAKEGKELAEHYRVSEDAEIRLVKKSPDVVEYSSSNPEKGLAVFSEIFYSPGWKLYIDDKEEQIVRVDYLLRAAVIPAGKHKLRMAFSPDSVKRTEWFSSVSAWGILLLLLLGCPLFYIFKLKNKSEGRLKPQA